MSSPLPPIAAQSASRGIDPAPSRPVAKDDAFGMALQDAVRKAAGPDRPSPGPSHGASAAGIAADDTPEADATPAADRDPADAAADIEPAKADSADNGIRDAAPPQQPDATAVLADPVPQADPLAVSGQVDASIVATLIPIAMPPADTAAATRPALDRDDKTPPVAGAATPPGRPVPAADAASGPKAAPPSGPPPSPARQPAAAEAGNAGAKPASPAPNTSKASSATPKTPSPIASTPQPAQPAPRGAEADGAETAGARLAHQAAIAALPPELRQMMANAGNAAGGTRMPTRTALPGPAAAIDPPAAPGAEAGLAPRTADPVLPLAVAGIGRAEPAPEPARPAAAPAPEPPAAAHPASTAHAEIVAAPDLQAAASPAPHAAASVGHAKPAPDAPSASVATQILPAVVSMAKGGGIGRRVSISITPNEMGEVSITVERGPNGTTQIQVGAERLATLELLRRDHGELVRALGDAGVAQDRSSLSFSWDGGGSFSPGWGPPGEQGHGQPGRQPQNAFARTYAEETPPVSAATAIATARGGIDVTA